MKKQFYLFILLFSFVLYLGMNAQSELRKVEYPLLDVGPTFETLRKGTREDNKPAALAQNPTELKYLIFSNMMDPTLFGGAFFSAIQAMQKYNGKFTVAPFDNSFFQNNKITDYDVVAFPLGDYPISVMDATRRDTVHKKIIELINAGKKVLIATHRALWFAFNPDPQAAVGKVADAQNLLSNTLGISYLTTLKMIKWSGTTGTYTPYAAKGTPKDPIGLAHLKDCNVTFMGESPMKFDTLVDVFKSKDQATFIDIDHFQWGQTSPYTDTLLGIRTKIGDARVVFFSYSLDNIAQAIARQNLLERSLDWLTEEAPQPGAQIEKMQSELNFGDMTLGDSLELTAGFKNIGLKDLIIDSIYIDDSFFQMGGFYIIDGGNTPVTVKTGETHAVTVKFKPKDKAQYFAFLKVKSNSTVSSTESVDLKGGAFGGSGPIIASNLTGNILNFGKVKAMVDKPVMDIPIMNRGTQDLIISEAKINPTNVPFVLVGYQNDITIQSGKTYNYSVRFQPVKSDTTYDAEVKFTSNANNSPTFIVKLHGETQPKLSVEPAMHSVAPSIGLFDVQALPNPFKGSSVIKYSLKGYQSKELKINLVDLTGNIILEVIKQIIAPGEYTIELNAGTIPSGTYYLNCIAGDERQEIRLMILK